VAALAAVLVAALVPATLYFMRTPPRPARIVYELPAPGFIGRNGDLAISPDAMRIAYVATVNGAQRVWVRSIGSLDARELAGTDNAGGLFWSPDSRYIAFTAGNLKRIEAAGGPVQNVADALGTSPGAWGTDGSILFSTAAADGGLTVIGRVSANGGPVTRLTAIDPASGQVLQLEPTRLPGGELFLYLSTGAPTSTARVASVQRGDLKPVLGLERDVSGIAYAAGFMFYRRDGGLVAQPFDTNANALALRGTPTVIAERVGPFSVADDALVFSETAATAAAGNPQRQRRLAWVDRRGQPLGVVDAPAGYMTPVLSPDEHRLAIRAPDPSNNSGDIWTIDIARGVTTRLTSDPADEGTPLFSPDGTRVVFGSGRAGNSAVPNAIYQRAANGTGSDDLLFAARANEVVAPLTWAPDGSFLLFGRAAIATFRTKIAIWKLDLSGERTATPLLDAPFVFGNAQLSSDGRWLAYTSNESGTNQIVIQSFPDLARDKRQVSTRGGYEPRWRADGRELFYLTPDGALMSLDVPVGAALEPSVPRKLFDTGIPVESLLSGTRPDYFYAVAEDGERFLLNEPIVASGTGAASPTAPPTIRVIVNWATGLLQP
jgi:Tol biopolymer transport system component